MGWLERALGKEPPAIPVGARYILDGGSSTADPFQIKLVLAGQNTGDPTLKVMFSTDNEIDAGRYRAWLEGGAQYRPPRAKIDLGTRDNV